MKGTLKNGFAFDVDPNVLDDMELIDALAQAQGEDATAISKVLVMVLGVEQRNRLYDVLREENGRVPIKATMESIVEIFEAMGNSGKNQ